MSPLVDPCCPFSCLVEGGLRWVGLDQQPFCKWNERHISVPSFILGCEVEPIISRIFMPGLSKVTMEGIGCRLVMYAPLPMAGGSFCDQPPDRPEIVEALPAELPELPDKDLADTKPGTETSDGVAVGIFFG